MNIWLESARIRVFRIAKGAVSALLRARNGPHQKLQHHRPHRPRQIDPGRPSSISAAACPIAKWRRRCSISMDIERERGITIKAQTAALSYKGA